MSMAYQHHTGCLSSADVNWHALFAALQFVPGQALTCHTCLGNIILKRLCSLAECTSGREKTWYYCLFLCLWLPCKPWYGTVCMKADMPSILQDPRVFSHSQQLRRSDLRLRPQTPALFLECKDPVQLMVSLSGGPSPPAPPAAAPDAKSR